MDTTKPVAFRRVFSSFVSALLWQFETVKTYGTVFDYGNIRQWSGTYASGFIAEVVRVRQSDQELNETEHKGCSFVLYTKGDNHG